MGYVIAHVGAFDFENYGDLFFTDALEFGNQSSWM